MLRPLLSDSDSPRVFFISSELLCRPNETQTQKKAIRIKDPTINSISIFMFLTPYEPTILLELIAKMVWGGYFATAYIDSDTKLPFPTIMIQHI